MTTIDMSTLATSFKGYDADLAAFVKVRKQLEETLQAYSVQQKALAKSISKTEILLDQVLSKDKKNQIKIQEATRHLQQAEKNSNDPLLKLQVVIQNENRIYTSISNILKLKHDTAKNSISNIR